MARSGTYGTKQNKVEDCRQWHMHHQGGGFSGHLMLRIRLRQLLMNTWSLCRYFLVGFQVSAPYKRMFFTLKKILTHVFRKKNSKQNNTKKIKVLKSNTKTRTDLTVNGENVFYIAVEQSNFSL
jgi:hypothetical protein